METLATPEYTGVQYGPLPEEGTLTTGLDHYKLTMGQVQFERNPDAEVTFTFKNRGKQRLADYIEPEVLQARLDALQERSWTPDELSYFRSLRNDQDEQLFSDEFVDYLGSNRIPDVTVRFDEELDDLAIESTGEWPLVTHWETVVMSEVNEAYFESYIQAHGLDLMEIYDEGDRRLSEKIAVLQSRPDIKFADFGSRRHFSYRWQKHVDERLRAECPDNLIGTSNLALARTLEIKPSGTFAHEMYMVYCGIADALGKDVRAAHGQVLDDWYETYGEEYSVALTDTYGSDFFFTDFTEEQAREYRATRHDSGDPFEYAEKVIQFYEQKGIDPTTKTIVFSDGLDLDTIVKLQDYFAGRINTVYGWGTTLTNDLGLEVLNIVMKATQVRVLGEYVAKLVKLSDNPGKHTGPEDKVEEYQETFHVEQLAA